MAIDPDSDDNFQHRAWQRRRSIVLFSLITMLALVGTAIMAWVSEKQLHETEQRLYIFDKTPAPLEQARKLEAALGYEGFLGTLNDFHKLPAAATLQRLRENIEQADRSLMTIAASAPLKLDIRIGALQGALQLYKQALVQAEAVMAGTAAPDPAAATRLDDVYNNVIAAGARMERAYQAENLATLRQQQSQQGQLLWLSLFISVALIAGVWILARGAYSHPLHKLLSSLRSKNAMDKNIPLWGTTRSDAIGDLARALDALRQKLLNAPDILVMKGDNAMPLRFGGAGGAVFQSLVDELASAVANIRAAELPTTLDAIQQLNKSIASTVGSMYSDLKTSTDAIHHTSTSLVAAEAKTSIAAASLAERAQTIGEVAQLTGAQVQTSLRDLLHAQAQIKNTAAAGDAVMRGFATKSSELSERLIASTNLMRAGGKVLQETVESLRGRVLDAASALAENDEKINSFLASSEGRLAGLAQRAEEAFASTTELAAAGERISSTANRLELSESDLNRAVAAMMSQSEKFGPLSTELRTLHEQLSQHMTKQVAVSDDVTARLAAQVDKLSKLEAMADSLAHILSQINDLPAKLAPLQTINDGALGKLGTALEANTAATEMNAMRMDANLRLVSDQLSDLLQKLNTEQTSLLEQVSALRCVLTGAPVSSITPQHIAEVERALSARVEAHYQQFTADLTALLQRFEEAVAKPPVEITPPAPVDMQTAILQQLKAEKAEPSLLDESTDADVTTALNRLAHIKKLTGALTRQAHVLGEETSPEAQAERAKQLIGEVMSAITDLTQLASDISDMTTKG